MRRIAAEVQREVTRLETVLTPQAYHDRLTRETRGFGSAIGAAMARSVVAADLAGFAGLEPFCATGLSDAVTLYHGAGMRGNRRLLVAFAGRFHRMSVPTPIFLQRVRAAEWDVLMLRDPQLAHFRGGSPGFATSLADIAARLRDLVRPYAGAMLLGNSMGALPAVQVALLAGGLPAVAVGAQRFSDVMRLFAPGPVPQAFDPVCACLPAGRRDFRFGHAEHHAADRDSAAAFAALTGGVAWPIAGTAQHATLSELWQTGRLGSFLDQVLDPGGDGPRTPERPPALPGTDEVAGLRGPLRRLLRRARR